MTDTDTNNYPQKNLDSFLTSIESKLRGPFSSLDWTKTITTPALRGASVSEREYLDRVLQVVSKTDKITQCRILIGLLGLGLNASDDETGDVVRRIVRQAQEAPAYDEWVRVIAALVQRNLHPQATDSPVNTTGLGPEARNLLEKTCSEIIERITKLQAKTEGADEDAPSRFATADADPNFAPFRYALIKPTLLEQVIKETQSHAHFTINASASVLSMDADMELLKANEDKEHVASSSLVGLGPGTASTLPVAQPEPFMPGMRSHAAATNGSNTAKPKSSLFIPRKPVLARSVDATSNKSSLHTRKAGAAQALLMKGRRNNNFNAQSAPAASVTVGGLRGGRLNNNKSRMKVIDVTEVQDLSKQEKLVEDATTKIKKTGLKRKPEAALAEKVAKPKIEIGQPQPQQARVKDELPKKAPDDVKDGALAAAALAAYQTQTTAPATTAQPPQLMGALAAAEPPVTTTPAKQQEWRQMLRTKSNRLSAEDRIRIEQFFQQRLNPTPSETTYKIKLHEVRGTDPKTGVQVKETDYLILDYSTFTCNKSKKVKRY
jgi:hypothetical protein